MSYSAVHKSSVWQWKLTKSVKPVLFQANIQRYVHTHTGGVQWPKRLFAGLWLRRSGLDAITVHMGFMVYSVEGLNMQCWRRIEKFCWTDRVRNEEVIPRFKEDRNILHTIKIRKAKWIGHILHKNYISKHVIKEKDRGNNVTGRRERRGKQLLDDLKEK